MPPCKFGELVLQIQLEGSERSFVSWRLWVEGAGWIILLGVERLIWIPIRDR